MQPALFLPHGAPDLALADIPAARFLQTVLDGIARPDGIVIISAHWETISPEMTSAPRLSTIYDFGGFSRDLYAITYPAKTARWLIDAVDVNLRSHGISTNQNPNRGLDHGAWSPLRLVAPTADIPVVQLSLPRNNTPADQFDFGRALSSLRAQNVLVIGSGASVHNLRYISPEGTPPPSWAVGFDDWLDKVLVAQDWPSLFDFERQPNGRLCHPTVEHFLPLIVAAGAGVGRNGNTQAKRLHHSYSYGYGSIGMSAWEFSELGCGTTTVRQITER